MNDLGQDARALLELAREAHDPGEGDRARVRTKLASQLGVAAGLGVAVGLGAAAKTTAAVGAGAGMAAGAGASAGAGVGVGFTAGTLGTGAAALKLIGAVLVVSATVGAGAVAVHHVRRAPVARVAVPEKVGSPSSPRRTAPGPAAVGAPTGLEAAPAEASVPVTGPPQQSARMRPSAAPPSVASPAQKPAQALALAPTSKEGVANRADARAEVPTRRSGPAVADEASLFHDGIVALRSGQPARALELFDLHARLYPRGVLAEERDAERALALANLDRSVEARAAIDQFLQAHPTSPLAARLQARARLLEAAGAEPGSDNEPGRAVTKRHDP
jgi:hypothetical protein